MKTEYHETMDQIEAALQEFPSPNITTRHFFSPGMYCREMTAPGGAIVTSKIHKTEHQYVLSVGSLTVKTEDGDEIFVKAPYIGVTKPGTRRIAYFHSESVWTTVHYLDWVIGDEERDMETFCLSVSRAEDDLIENYENPLLGQGFVNLIQ